MTNWEIRKKLSVVAVETWEKYEKKKKFTMPLVWMHFKNIVFEAFVEGYIKGYKYGKIRYKKKTKKRDN